MLFTIAACYLLINHIGKVSTSVLIICITLALGHDMYAWFYKNILIAQFYWKMY